jgi:hypothetical protein
VSDGTDEFPGLGGSGGGDGSRGKGWWVPPWMVAELKAVGAGEEAVNALRFVRCGASQAKLHAFFLHFYLPANAAILPTLARLAEAIIRDNCNLPIGGMSLVGHARCVVPGFTLANDFAVFYVVALRRWRPALAQHLEHTSQLAALLHLSGWNPQFRNAEVETK